MNMDSYKKGYERANKDLKEMGFHWTYRMACLRWKCSGMDEDFSRGYSMRVSEEVD